MSAARRRVESLRARLEGRDGTPVLLIETHISWVLLAAAEAWKIKKPIRLPFLDFSALADRRRYCEEELRINRRLAPDLYLDVLAVCDGPDGPCFGGWGTAVDYAVRMRRFADGALWSERLAAGTLVAAQVDAFAGRLAEFHRDAAVATEDSGFGSAAVHERIARRLIAGIDAWQAESGSASREWPALRSWVEQERARLADRWRARLRAGRIREGHGDLHLANIVQLGEDATAFDAIEFDAELRWIDVLDDLAFLVMDLAAHGRSDLAFRLLDAYLEASGDYEGLPVLRYFLVMRALVRSQVATLRETQEQAARTSGSAETYLRLASDLAAGPDPRLLITHGLPGSGKTFLSQGMLESAGAVRIRSDVERKRLFGLAALQSSRTRPDLVLYDAAATRDTYARLLAAAQSSLEGGWPTVVDAAFLKRDERELFAALATARALPFSILDCRGSMPLLRSRVQARQLRGDDASEADEVVLARLSTAVEPLDAGERRVAIVVEAERPPAPTVLAGRWLAELPASA